METPIDPVVKVSDQIALFLKAKGIRHVFGIIGSANAHIFDSIDRLGFTQIVCVHHEQAATMAMQTYYRTSGVITAAIVTAGGGSTNAITGVVSAWADSIPGIVISGQENSKYIKSMGPMRMWGIQGYDSTLMVKSVTKYAARVMDASRTLLELETAYVEASSGRPGPVWLDFPMDIQGTRLPQSAYLQSDLPVPTSARAQEGSLAEVLSLLATSKRPLFWFGNGIRLAQGVEELKQLIERIPIPFLLSWAGSDLIDNDHPRHFGRAGVYGQRSSNFILQNADLVVAVGTRLSISMIGYEQSELVRSGRLVYVDIDELELEKITKPNTLKVCSDAKAFISDLLVAYDKGEMTMDPPSSWMDYCSDVRKDYPWLGPEHRDTNGYINSYAFLSRFSQHFKPDQHITTDMGTALLSGHQILKLTQQQRLMTSTGLGEMGYALPAAIGMSFARDGGEVLCLNCDGGMMMNLQELQTISHHHLPIKTIVFNNDGYLMIKHTQKNLFKGHYTATNEASGVTCPSFEKVAAAFDLPYLSIRTWEEFDSVIPALQAAPGPILCEVFMDPEQYFFPKLGLVANPDGTIVSPPLEDLSPLLPRDELSRVMLNGLHPKSTSIQVK
uniref:IlvB n=1 Tax=Spirochaeta aurantia TaxID=147 RepID=Q0PHX7_SPIAU|nr:IlvB [Spirochaeta aurantia]